MSLSLSLSLSLLTSFDRSSDFWKKNFWLNTLLRVSKPKEVNHLRTAPFLDIWAPFYHHGNGDASRCHTVIMTPRRQPTRSILRKERAYMCSLWAKFIQSIVYWPECVFSMFLVSFFCKSMRAGEKKKHKVPEKTQNFSMPSRPS